MPWSCEQDPGAGSSLPPAAGPCPAGGLLPPAASPCSALGSSPGRLSAEPGRRQRPCPGTQPLGHSRDPALHHSPGHPCRCPAAPSPPLCTSQQRRPGSSWQGRDVAGPGAPSRNLPCTALQPEPYRVRSCADCSCTELSSARTLQAACNPCVPGACAQSPQPCCAVQRSCSWAQLSLCTRALLPAALSGPRARPSSAPQAQPKALQSPLGGFGDEPTDLRP